MNLLLMSPDVCHSFVKIIIVVDCFVRITKQFESCGFALLCSSSSSSSYFDINVIDEDKGQLDGELLRTCVDEYYIQLFICHKAGK